MTKIVISKNGKEAAIYIPGMPTKGLYHSEGKVIELVLWYLLPSIPKHVNIGCIEQALAVSMEDTQPIIKAA